MKNRRDFIKVGMSAAAGIAVSGCTFSDDNAARKKIHNTKPHLIDITPIKKVKIGFVGVGSQGSSHVKNFLNIENVEIKAVCDIIPEKVNKIQK